MTDLLTELKFIASDSSKKIRESDSTTDLPDILVNASNDKLTNGEILLVLGSYYQNPTVNYVGLNDELSVSQNLNLSPLKQIGLRFLKSLIHEIRKLICNEKNLKKEIQKSLPEVTVTALSTTIMTSIGVTQPIALGLSSLTLLILFRATKGTFCSFTDEEIFKNLK